MKKGLRVYLAHGIRPDEAVVNTNDTLEYLEGQGITFEDVTYAGYHCSRHYFLMVGRPDQEEPEPQEP